MSEYQYYDFRAVDRALDDQQMKELRAISSRASITRSSFVNSYNYGDLRAQPRTLMEKYFDAMLYLANWGSRLLMLRLPKHLVDPEAMARYSATDGLSVSFTDDHVILSFSSEDEGGDGWIDGDEALLASMMPLREDLLAGDFRCLYLGWLMAAQDHQLEDEDEEPPVPPGLGQLSAPLEAFVDFLRIEPDWIEAAAERSDQSVTQQSTEGLKQWIESQPVALKNDWLIRLAEGNGIDVSRQMHRQFRLTLRSDAAPEPDVAPRTVAQLRERAKFHEERLEQMEAERRAQEKAKRDREKAAARLEHLSKLVGEEERLWAEVKGWIPSKTPKDYGRAVQHLVDLRDLALQQGEGESFWKRLRQLRELHRTKRSLIKLMDDAGLIGGRP